MTDELIQRLEKATGPDRELDHDIARILQGYHYTTRLRDFPAYTSSIDAALTLVPEGCGYVVHGPYHDGKYFAGVSHTPNGQWDDDNPAATAAIALCIAALKARAAPDDMAEDGGKCGTWERPKCKHCGLEDGACICAHLRTASL